MRSVTSIGAALALALSSCGGDGGASPEAAGDGGAPPSGDGGASAPDAPAMAATWTTKRSLPSAKQEVAVVALERKVYVLGGFDGSGRIIPDVSVYDPKTDAWSAAAALPKPLHHINAAVSGGKIWVVGALEGTGFDAVGETLVYDPTANTWTPKKPMPAGTERGASMTAAIGALVYVAGGFRGGPVAEFSAYDTASDSWTALPALDTPRDHGAGAAEDGIFYALGGRGGAIGSHVPRVDAFDPKQGTWAPRAPMPTSRAGAACAVARGRIVVIGGEGNAKAEGGVFAEVESYDPSANAWAILPAMKTPRHGMGAAAVDDVIYVPGGGDRQAFAATDVVEALTF